MIEPTETEAKETLDEFCEAMLAIVRESAEQPQVLEGRAAQPAGVRGWTRPAQPSG